MKLRIRLRLPHSRFGLRTSNNTSCYLTSPESLFPKFSPLGALLGATRFPRGAHNIYVLRTTGSNCQVYNSLDVGACERLPLRISRIGQNPRYCRFVRMGALSAGAPNSGASEPVGRVLGLSVVLRFSSHHGACASALRACMMRKSRCINLALSIGCMEKIMGWSRQGFSCDERALGVCRPSPSFLETV